MTPAEHVRAFGLPLLAAAAAIVVALSGSDVALFLFVNGGPARTSALDGFWQQATMLGDGAVGAAMALVFYRRKPQVVAAAALCALLVLLAVHGTKHLVPMSRPVEVLGAAAIHVIGIAPGKGSFPSGHATTAAAFAAILCLAFPGLRVAVLALAFATLVGVSRIAVGAHWPTDVLAGLVIGWLVGAAATALVRRSPALCRPKPQAAFAVLMGGAACYLLLVPDRAYPDAAALRAGLAVAGLLAAALSFVRWPAPARSS